MRPSFALWIAVATAPDVEPYTTISYSGDKIAIAIVAVDLYSTGPISRTIDIAAEVFVDLLYLLLRCLSTAVEDQLGKFAGQKRLFPERNLKLPSATRWSAIHNFLAGRGIISRSEWQITYPLVWGQFSACPPFGTILNICNYTL